MRDDEDDESRDPIDAALRLAGHRKGYADAGVVDDDSGGLLDFLGRLSPGEQAIAEHAPEIGQLAREELPSTMAELTPVPAGLRALHDLQQGEYGEAAGEIAPWAASIAMSALRFVPKGVTIPALVGGTAALLGSAADTSAKNEKSKEVPGVSFEENPNLRHVIQSDPQLQAMEAQIKATEAIANAPPLGTKDARGNDIGQSLTNRQRASEQLPDLRAQFAARIGELTKGSLPFDKAHPWLASNMPWLRFVAPMAAAYATRATGNLASRWAAQPWNKAVTEAEEAITSGSSNADFLAGKAREFLRQHEGDGTAASAADAGVPPPRPLDRLMSRFLGDGEGSDHFVRETALPVVAGTTLGSELSLLPYQYNRFNAPEGSQERNEAMRALAPGVMFETMAPGAVAGFMGGLTGSHLLPAGLPGRDPIPESRNVADWLERRQGPLVDAAEQLGREANRVVPPSDTGTAAATDESTPARLIERMRQGREVVPPRPQPRRRAVSKSSNQPDASTKTDVELSPRQVGERQWEEITGQVPPPKPKRSIPSSKAPPAPAVDPDTGFYPGFFRRGGIVGRALDIARQYAAGGAVHAGPITQAADGGRTDTVAMNVESGAYVVPADIVSFLGEGDTVNGYKILNHMFGAPDVNHHGHTTPIMAAGGEYVISPRAVARVGRGDMKAGHDALDHWVKMERRKCIQKLKKLPGPQRD
jgi:hypothetical protein